MKNAKGFLASLLDLSFSNFITTKLIKALYVLIIAVAAIAALITIIGGFSESFGYGLLRFIIGIVGFLVCVILARIYLEVTIILFKIEENTRKIPAEAKSEASSTV